MKKFLLSTAAFLGLMSTAAIADTVAGDVTNVGAGQQCIWMDLAVDQGDGTTVTKTFGVPLGSDTANLVWPRKGDYQVVVTGGGFACQGSSQTPIILYHGTR